MIQGECADTNPDIQSLSLSLSDSSAIACRGSSLQLYNQGRYWGNQYGKNASIVVFPYTAQDVAHAVLTSAVSTPAEAALSFVSGAHGQTNASSTTGFLIDLSWMNSSAVQHNVTLDDVHIDTAIVYDAGANWGHVYAVTNGSGYIPVGARDSSVGVGGFSTGGGIGFLAGAYGYAIDRLRAMQVVLMSGEIVLATKTNAYSDLFWALQGGNGQFGIVTRFWQEAAIEPEVTEVGIWVVANNASLLERVYENVAAWFDDNDDPFSLVYYAVGYLPADVTSGSLGIDTTMVGYRFSDPANPNQKSFTETFAPLLAGVNLTLASTFEIPLASASELLNPYFPYGFRRGFWGPQTTKVTADYIRRMSARFTKYVTDLLSRGESPYSATWVLQYMPPGLNGNLPTSDTSTAWPHSVSAHQTLFSPAWNFSRDDALADLTSEELRAMTYEHQAKLQPSFLADYPNYMSPGVDGKRVFGGNLERLVHVKEKYDPECRLHQGRVFATEACVLGGWANLY